MEEMETLRPTRELYRIIRSKSYAYALKEAFQKVPADQRKLKYEGSISTAYIIPSECATNFCKITRFMIRNFICSKLITMDWKLTLTEQGTE